MVPKIYVHPESVNVTLVEKRVFLAIMKLKILRSYNLGLWWALHPMASILIREKKRRNTHRTGWYEDSERLKGYTWKPKDAKDCWQLPEAGEKLREDSPSEPSEETTPDSTLTLDLWLPELWGNILLLCHVIKNCGNLLQQPQETNTEAVTQTALPCSALNWCYMSAAHPAPKEPCQTPICLSPPRKHLPPNSSCSRKCTRDHYCAATQFTGIHVACKDYISTFENLVQLLSMSWQPSLQRAAIIFLVSSKFNSSITCAGSNSNGFK